MVKKIFFAFVLIITITTAFAVSHDELAMIDTNSNSFHNIDIRNNTRSVPAWQFNLAPINLMNSYYDYMIGSDNDLPIVQNAYYNNAEYYLTFQGMRTASGINRVFYAYLSENGDIHDLVEISDNQQAEGYPAMDLDPVSRKPLYAWQTNADNDPSLEVEYSYDRFVGGMGGMLTDAYVFFDNPATLASPYNTSDNEFIKPSVRIGPSPISGMRRVYVLTRNTKNHSGSSDKLCSNVKIAYVDINANSMELGRILVWSYISVPLLDSWNHDSEFNRATHYAFTVDDEGNLFYIGYHSTYSYATGLPVDEPDIDVFVCSNYGQGTWQRYSSTSKLASWNPPTDNGTGPGYFKNPDNVPYSDEQLYWKIANSEHINATCDNNYNNYKLHCSAMWCLTDKDHHIYSEYNTIKEINFNTVSHTFLVREIYPIGGVSTDNLCWQPWDTDCNGVVDTYDSSGNPVCKTEWNYPYWDDSAADDSMVSAYNNLKITNVTGYGWIACVWQNSAKAREYNRFNKPEYQQYADIPEIYISVSYNRGITWNDPIIINSLDVAQFAGNKPMWVYPANNLYHINNTTARLTLMYYDDNTWGSYSLNQTGLNDGGTVKFMSININSDAVFACGVRGYIRDVEQNQPIANVLVSAGDASCYTDAQGHYSLTLSPGIVSVSAQKNGYIAQTISNVNILPSSFTTRDFQLSHSPTLTITGSVYYGEPPIPLSNAIVSLEGFESYTVITNSQGRFSIPNLLENSSYNLYVSKNGFTPYNEIVSIDTTSLDLGIIALNELILPVTGTSAIILPGNDIVQIQWVSPQNRELTNRVGKDTSISKTRMLSAFHVWRLNPGEEGNETSWIPVGEVPGTSFTINDSSWSTLDTGSYLYAIKARFNDADYTEPAFTNEVTRSLSGSISGLVKDFSGNIIRGAEITFTRIIDNGHGPYSCVTNQIGQYNLTDVWYGGYNLSCQADGFTLFYASPIQIQANHNLQYYINLLDSLYAPVNVLASLHQEDNYVSVDWQPPNVPHNRALQGYLIWRLAVTEEENQAHWVALTGLINTTHYNDYLWQHLPDVQYKYAIKAVYSFNSSDPVFSNAILHETGIIDETAVNTAILSCYPNPFDKSTKITYSVKKPGPVQLEIFNLQGQIVRTVSQINNTKGINSMNWNGDDINGYKLPSGMYIIRMQANGATSKQKVMLLK